MKVVEVTVILFVVLLLTFPAASAQGHPGENFPKVVGRKIAVRQIDENKLGIEENFTVVSRTDNFENIILMVDRGFRNLDLDKDLKENYLGGSIYKLRLRKPLGENQKITIHVRYDLPGLTFQKPIWYPSEDMVVYADMMEGFGVDSSVPLGRSFSVQFGDEITVQMNSKGPPSSPSPTTYPVWGIVAVLVVLFVVIYFGKNRIMASEKSEERGPSGEKRGIIKRLEEDFERGKIPEDVYREIRSELEDETNE